MQKWEYAGCNTYAGMVLSAQVGGKSKTYAKVDWRSVKGKEIPFVDWLNKMGKKGWELVTLSSNQSTGGGSSFHRAPVTLRAILKRPR